MSPAPGSRRPATRPAAPEAHRRRRVFDGGELIDASGGATAQARGARCRSSSRIPYASLNPRMTVGRHRRRGLRDRTASAPARPLGARRELLDVVGLDPSFSNRYPHEFSGRPAPADRRRPRARAEPEADRLRRAGLRARRLDPGADPEPAQGPPARLRAGVPLHLARPLRRPLDERRHRRHEGRQDRRGRRCGRGLPAAAERVHEGAAGVGAGARPAADARARAPSGASSPTRLRRAQRAPLRRPRRRLRRRGRRRAGSPSGRDGLAVHHADGEPPELRRLGRARRADLRGGRDGRRFRAAPRPRAALRSAPRACWQTRRRLPEPVRSRRGAALGGRFYVVGGTTPDGGGRQVLRLRPGRDEWERRAPLPAPRSNHAVVALDGKLWVVGGWHERERADVFVYDPRRDRWSRGPSLPRPTHALGAVAFRGELLGDRRPPRRRAAARGLDPRAGIARAGGRARRCRGRWSCSAPTSPATRSTLSGSGRTRSGTPPRDAGARKRRRRCTGTRSRSSPSTAGSTPSAAARRRLRDSAVVETRAL